MMIRHAVVCRAESAMFRQKIGWRQAHSPPGSRRKRRAQQWVRCRQV
nr:hypothetical protein [uncultured Chitinophaga sp.]